MNSKEWVIVVSAILLVGIVSSVVSVGMTGNIISVLPVKIKGGEQVYTIGEVYNKNQTYNKVEVTNMLSILNNNKAEKSQVYTKAEVDALIKTLPTSCGCNNNSILNSFKFQVSANSVIVTANVTEGNIFLPLIYGSNSTFLMGRDSLNKLVTNSAISSSTTDAGITLYLNDSVHNYFVATYISGKNAETYAYKLGNIETSNGDNKTTLTSIVSGGKDVTLDNVGDKQDLGASGKIQATLVSAKRIPGYAIIKLNAKAGTVYADRIVTKDGLMMNLPLQTSFPTPMYTFKVYNNNNLIESDLASWNNGVIVLTKS